MMRFTRLIITSSFIFLIFGFVESQVLFNSERDEGVVIWCTVNIEEQRKCEVISEALKLNEVVSGSFRRSDQFKLHCNQTQSKDECMAMMDSNLVDITTLDPGEVFVAGRYHSLVPILEEVYKEEGGTSTNNKMYAVAIVKRTMEFQSLKDMRGKKACFAGVGTLAGWVVPINRLMQEGDMEIMDCNNHVKSAINYFGPSCAVNSLTDKYNPLGDNSDKLCSLCASDLPGVRCTSNDPFAGYEGALSCLLHEGDIAFVKHSSVLEFFNQRSDSDIFFNNNNLTGNPPSNVFPFTTSSTTMRSLFGFNNQDNQNFSGFQFGDSQRGRNFDQDRIDFGGDRSGDRINFNGDRSGDRINFGGDRTGDRSNSPGFDSRYPSDRIRPSDSRSGTATLPSGKSMSLNEFKSKYDLLCPDGSRRNVDEWRYCYWAELPSHAVVTSSAKSPSLRLRYQRFVQALNERINDRGPIQPQGQPQGFGQQFGQQQNIIPVGFSLFESIPLFGNRSNLLFQDAAVSFRSIPEQDQTYVKYLGGSLQAIMDIRSCPVGRVTLCVTSDAEMVKCVKMRTALNAQILKPEMSCYKGHSHLNCMQAIRNGDADVAVLDAGDVYTAGYHYDLIPILAEIYNLGLPEYYAVAVAYQGDAETELTYLKGKYSCHSGIGHAAGWVIPMAYLISSGRMRHYGCDSVLAASQYFSKSCVPGALSNEYNFGQEHHNLCDLCHGSSYSYCSRDSSEDFYGTTGAFRCLIEGGGQVAFVKHTTASEVTDGKRQETWARNTLLGDYELLCKDGTRAPVTDYLRCNLGKVKANAVVIRGGEGHNETETNAIINLFLYAQQFYGRKLEDDFNFGMFYSPEPYSDLIFQDAAQQLQIIPPEQRNFRDYLGKSFLRARALVDCHASVTRIEITNIYVLYTLMMSLLLSYYYIGMNLF